MEIQVFSDTKSVVSAFTGLKGNKDFSVKVHSAKELAKALKQVPGSIFIYIDISSFSQSEQGKALKAIEKQKGFAYGFIDPAGQLKDPSNCFHTGASDYLGKEMMKSGITSKRIKDAISFKKIPLKECGENKDLSGYTLSGKDWSKVKDGAEYTFCLMFIELDNKKTIRSFFGGEQLNEFLGTFQNYIQKMVTSHHGKIWMWQDWGGLILFPFDGETCDAILDCVRLMMNRNIFSSEIFDIDIIVAFRIALHLGNTVYRKRGETGKIISDAINSVFHLGQKFADPENFFMTGALTQFVPKGLEKLFIPAGDYEGRDIVRMRRPIY